MPDRNILLIPEKSQCPLCGQPVEVNLKGRIALHKARAKGVLTNCEAGGTIYSTHGKKK